MGLSSQISRLNNLEIAQSLDAAGGYVVGVTWLCDSGKSSCRPTETNWHLCMDEITHAHVQTSARLQIQTQKYELKLVIQFIHTDTWERSHMMSWC